MASIAIYGSCVSRDALHLVTTHQYKLAMYFARSSLASSCAKPSDALAELVMAQMGNIESEFQRRMVSADVMKTAVPALSSSRWDALVVDLIDERFNLFDASAGIATVSNEFLRTGFKPGVDELTKPGSSRHWDLWRRGLDGFCRVMSDRPVVLNEAYWAEVTVDGASLEPKFAVKSNNDLLARMYEEFRARLPGCHTIEYPKDLLKADPNHRWGLSPFHYDVVFYSHTIRRLDDFIGGDRT